MVCARIPGLGRDGHGNKGRPKKVAIAFLWVAAILTVINSVLLITVRIVYCEEIDVVSNHDLAWQTKANQTYTGNGLSFLNAFWLAN